MGGKLFRRESSSCTSTSVEDERGGGGTTPKTKKKVGEKNCNVSENHVGSEKEKADSGHQTKQTNVVPTERGAANVTAFTSANGTRRPRSSPSPVRPPPGLSTVIDSGISSQQTNSSSTPHDPRGHCESQCHQIQPHQQAPSIPDPARLSIHESSRNQPESLHLPIQPDALFVIVPRAEIPDPLPGESASSLSVPAARHFIETYYSHFADSSQAMQINNLVRYYTAKAQKSVSIGGAHSVVTGRRDIAAQILNLAGAAFVVRGVVAQDTADGKGVHILITGTARTGGVLASFAHSVSLTPVQTSITMNGMHTNGNACLALKEALDVGFPFQIHNDALALLSGDAPPSPAPVSQPPSPMQHHPLPPPPGMF